MAYLTSKYGDLNVHNHIMMIAGWDVVRNMRGKITMLLAKMVFVSKKRVDRSSIRKEWHLGVGG